MVMDVVYEDEGNVQCMNHPYKNSSPGGICAFCLQEKLGKLVSSPSFRSDFGDTITTSTTTITSLSLQEKLNVTNSDCNSSFNNGSGSGSGNSNYHTGRTRLPFVKKKKKKDLGGVMCRSKSTTSSRRGVQQHNFLDGNCSEDNCVSSPHRRGSFWSFLYLSKHSTGSKKSDKHLKDLGFAQSTPSNSVVGMRSSVSGVGGSREKKRLDFVVVDENGSPSDDGDGDQDGSFDRKVSRSRSVGCGSRSFSGDFFAGFGDCTLRRVESHREGKGRIQSGGVVNGQDCIKERVRCGGIFSGFAVASSSSSSSVEDHHNHGNGNVRSISASQQLSHGRSRSWGWAFASPMRVFTSTKPAKRDSNASASNKTPNLDAIPSLLAVSG